MSLIRGVSGYNRRSETKVGSSCRHKLRLNQPIPPPLLDIYAGAILVNNLTDVCQPPARLPPLTIDDAVVPSPHSRRAGVKSYRRRQLPPTYFRRSADEVEGQTRSQLSSFVNSKSTIKMKFATAALLVSSASAYSFSGTSLKAASNGSSMSMATGMGVNGFGRIGRLVTRIMMEDDDIKLSAINAGSATTDYSK